MQEEVKIEHFTLSIKGLLILFSSQGTKTTLCFDACSTCALFEELELIEGFDNSEHEPIILYSSFNVKPYGWCNWCDFVKSFPFSEAQAKKIAKHHLEKKTPFSLPSKQKSKSEPLLTREALPPLHLYHIYQYYRTNISTSKK